MMDFERARLNMVEHQIRPWNVLDQDVLDLLMQVRREDFVPAPYRTMAFVDMEIPLDVDGERTGEFMLAPKVEARLLQALAVRRHETVLEVGAGSGFMAALLAHRARRVLSVETHASLVGFAGENLRRAGVGNATVEARDGVEFLTPGEDRFDVIVLSGGVAAIPDGLLARLNPGGRLAAIVGAEPVMSAELVRCVGPARFAVERLFETLAKPLHGFPGPSAFTF